MHSLQTLVWSEVFEISANVHAFDTRLLFPWLPAFKSHHLPAQLGRKGSKNPLQLRGTSDGRKQWVQ